MSISGNESELQLRTGEGVALVCENKNSLASTVSGLSTNNRSQDASHPDETQLKGEIRR